MNYFIYFTSKIMPVLQANNRRLTPWTGCTTDVDKLGKCD